MATSIIKEDFPTWALCYLINGDATNLSDTEVEMVDKWVKGWGESAVFEVAHANTLDYDLEVFFSPFPPFGLPCDCTEVYIIHANN